MKTGLCQVVLCAAMVSGPMLSGPAQAADGGGSFAVKGAGLQDCAGFQTAFDQGSPDLGIYMGWVEGYATALNQANDGIFDILPWQTGETLMRLLWVSCEALGPETKLIAATVGMLQSLASNRVSDASKVVGFHNGDRSVLLYEEILRRAHLRLGDLGYDLPSDPAEMTDVSVQAFEDFQKQQGIPVTGLPDQETLIKLFIKP